jgi:hypothetical protein
MADTSTLFPCCISICEPDSSTDLDYVINSGLGNNISCPGKFVVEFGTEKPIILLTPGQRISIGQIIGYMRGIKVRSKINGIITDVTDRYFIGIYDHNSDEILRQLNLSDLSEKSLKKLLTNNDESDFDKMNDLLKESSYTNNFIKDYILRFRFADIANNYINYSAVGVSQAYNNTSRICEIYDEAADAIIDRYNDEIKNLCCAENVRTYCENENLMGLKREIDETKKKYFDQILWQYNNVPSFGYNSGRISDMMLYDEYLNYITSDEFVYDDENPYVVELFYHITTFMQIRSRLELNNTNIAGLISKFNTLCNDNIRKYWDDKMYDYYGRIKQMFSFDFYADNEDDLIQANIYDKKRVTLYSKVLKYLTTLCNYTPPMSVEEKYKDMDVNSIINNAQIQDTASEKEAKQLYSNLKKIAIFFVQLRKIESEIDPKYFKQFASEQDYNDIFTLKEQLGTQNIKEYIISYNNIAALGKTSPAFRSAHSEFIAFERKYLDPFKKMVQSESRILRNLADRAINFYISNDNKINSGEIFDQFQEVDWGGKSTIFKDNEPHDFYYLVEHSPYIEDDGYKFDENSLRTQFGITDYEYWVKYCGVATIVNCMLPMYWPTGLVIAGVPIPMPIIYIPFVVIKGRVTVVIGLGICGICPLPMLLFVNFGDTPGSLIPSINIAIDTLKGLVSMIPSLSVQPIKETIKGMIAAQDNKINELKEKKNEIKRNIQNLQVGVKTDKETLRNLKKKRKDNHTTNTKKKQSSE